MNDQRPKHAFSVDVEDYFHVSGFSDRIHRNDWDHWPSRVEFGTRRALALLERHGVTGTFFVLGWVARKFPGLVREIQSAGHEIGCHSYWHRLVYDLTPDEFRDDLTLSRDLLQDLTGEPVTAFRAPSFSITRRSLWALEILAEEGFTLDSSIFPVRHDRYGIPDAPRAPYVIPTPGGEVLEFPGATVTIAGQTIPVGGGGYLRLYPALVTEQLLRQIERTERRPFFVYVHPWEFDPDQPRMPGSWKSRFRHYIGLASTERKLDRLLTSFAFTTMSGAADAAALRCPTPTLTAHPA